MTIDLALEIVELAVSLLKGTEVSAADTLLEIAQKADEAYHDEMGKPLDPFLIRPEQAV
jgi:hypothetical protein